MKDYDDPVYIDMERIQESIDSGEITLPKGLTGEQRREWIKKNLEESFLIIPGLLFEVKK